MNESNYTVDDAHKQSQLEILLDESLKKKSHLFSSLQKRGFIITIIFLALDKEKLIERRQKFL
jgi:hypothetical protein